MVKLRHGPVQPFPVVWRQLFEQRPVDRQEFQQFGGCTHIRQKRLGGGIRKIKEAVCFNVGQEGSTWLAESDMGWSNYHYD